VLRRTDGLRVRRLGARYVVWPCPSVCCALRLTVCRGHQLIASCVPPSYNSCSRSLGRFEEHQDTPDVLCKRRCVGVRVEWLTETKKIFPKAGHEPGYTVLRIKPSVSRAAVSVARCIAAQPVTSLRFPTLSLGCTRNCCLHVHLSYQI
jgi:hypothetical protein